MTYRKYVSNGRTPSRTDLIDFIMEYASDEIETIRDAIRIGKMSIQQLEDEVESIKAYYKETHDQIINLKILK